MVDIENKLSDFFHFDTWSAFKQYRNSDKMTEVFARFTPLSLQKILNAD